MPRKPPHKSAHSFVVVGGLCYKFDHPDNKIVEENSGALEEELKNAK